MKLSSWLPEVESTSWSILGLNDRDSLGSEVVSLLHHGLAGMVDMEAVADDV